jgi:hypothetical protein
MVGTIQFNQDAFVLVRGLQCAGQDGEIKREWHIRIFVLEMHKLLQDAQLRQLVDCVPGAAVDSFLISHLISNILDFIVVVGKSFTDLVFYFVAYVLLGNETAIARLVRLFDFHHVFHCCQIQV